MGGKQTMWTCTGTCDIQWHERKILFKCYMVQPYQEGNSHKAKKGEDKHRFEFTSFWMVADNGIILGLVEFTKSFSANIRF